MKYLGITKRLGPFKTGEELVKELKQYVTAPKDPKNGAPWPLVKEVEILCDKPLLKTGAVLVDLPGTGDSNRARNKVAQKYMSQCDRFWVVASIERFLDSQTVKRTCTDG